MRMLLVVVVVYDINHFIIPDELVVAIGVLAVVLVFFQSPTLSLSFGVTLLLQALTVFGFFAGLWYISKGRWIGFGDAKLSGVLAILLTPVGAMSLVLFSFWLGAIISVCILLMQRFRQYYKKVLRKQDYAGQRMVKPTQSITMKSEIPFAPFIVGAFMLVYWGSVSALAVTEYVLSIFITI